MQICKSNNIRALISCNFKTVTALTLLSGFEFAVLGSQALFELVVPRQTVQHKNLKILANGFQVPESFILFLILTCKSQAELALPSVLMEEIILLSKSVGRFPPESTAVFTDDSE